MTGYTLIYLLAVGILLAAGWLAKRIQVRLPLWISITGLVVTILATTAIGAKVQSRPEQIPFPIYASIYLGGVVIALVFTVLIFVGRRQRQEDAPRSGAKNNMVRGSPTPRGRRG